MSPELLAAVASILTAAAVLLTAWRSGRNMRRTADQADQKLDEIHILVNSRLSTALDEIASLKRQLTVAKDSAEE